MHAFLSLEFVSLFLSCVWGIHRKQSHCWIERKSEVHFWCNSSNAIGCCSGCHIWQSNRIERRKNVAYSFTPSHSFAMLNEWSWGEEQAADQWHWKGYVMHLECRKWECAWEWESGKKEKESKDMTRSESWLHTQSDAIPTLMPRYRLPASCLIPVSSSFWSSCSRERKDEEGAYFTLCLYLKQPLILLLCLSGNIPPASMMSQKWAVHQISGDKRG